MAFVAVTASAQLKVTDNNTVKIGEYTVLKIGSQGSFGQAQNHNLYYGNSFFIIETSVEDGEESSGIAFNYDGAMVWSAGDDWIFAFADEDGMSGNSSGVRAYVDDSGNFITVSDSSKKEEIKDLKQSLNKVKQLKPKQYYFKAKVRSNEKDSVSANNNGNNTLKSNEKKPRKPQVGFLAQDVEAVIPEAVSEGKDGTKYLNYIAIIPYLTEALQEQQATIEQQQADIEQLKKDVEELKKLPGKKK